jgi:hypothetical protein
MDDDAISLEELGQSKSPQFVDRAPPRPVDMDLLRAYHRNRLPEDDAEEVDHLIVLYREWHEANGVVLRELGSELVSGRATEQDTSKIAATNLVQLGTVQDRDGFNAYDNRSRDYLQRSYARLITHPSFMTVAHRSGGSPLDPYMEGLEKLICKDWKWEQQRQKPELLDDVDRVRAIANLIQASPLNIPFDSQLVAAILVKAGLDDLCDLT